MAESITYEFYRDTFGGELSVDVFGSCVGTGLTHVRWLCSLYGTNEESDAFKRAVCAATDAFAEYGVGQVGGFSIGGFSVKNYENKGTTGDELATAAALRELGIGRAFSGVL